MELQSYDFKISHCKGKDNVVADVCSRIMSSEPEENIDATIFISQMRIINEKRFLKWKNTLKKRRNKEMDENILSKYEQQQIEGITFVKEQDKWKAYVPDELKEELITIIHEQWGHYGTYKLYKLIRRYFYIKKLYKSIKRTIRTCDICQRVKGNVQIVELENIKPEKPNEIWAVDFYGPLISSGKDQQKYIFVVMDLFSKYIKLYPIKRDTAKNALYKLTKDCIVKLGKPKKIIADQGSQFISKIWNRTLRKEGITPVHTSVSHPMTNGCIERANKEISKMLRIYCYKKHENWTLWTSSIEHLINNTINRSTGFSPQEVHFKKTIISYPFDMIKSPKERSNIPKNIIQQTKRNMSKEAGKRNKWYKEKKKIKEHNLKVGDKVLITKAPHQNVKKGETPKLLPRYEGPYSITKKIHQNTFLLNKKNRNMYHANQLKKYNQ